jgi:hypothetical protein
MKEAHIFTVTKFFFVVLYSENVRRPLKENFGMVCPKICLQNPYPNPYPKKFFCIRIRKKVFGSATLGRGGDRRLNAQRLVTTKAYRNRAR